MVTSHMYVASLRRPIETKYYVGQETFVTDEVVQLSNASYALLRFLFHAS